MLPSTGSRYSPGRADVRAQPDDVEAVGADAIEIFVNVVVLKLVLEVVIILKTKVIDRLRAATTKRGKAVAASLWVVAAGSKFVVLELVDVVFGDAVSLGGFIPVTRSCLLCR